MHCKWSSVDIQAHQYFLLLCFSDLNLFSLCLKYAILFIPILVKKDG